MNTFDKIIFVLAFFLAIGLSFLVGYRHNFEKQNVRVFSVKDSPLTELEVFKYTGTRESYLELIDWMEGRYTVAYEDVDSSNGLIEVVIKWKHPSFKCYSYNCDTLYHRVYPNDYLVKYKVFGELKISSISKGNYKKYIGYFNKGKNEKNKEKNKE